MVQSGVWQGVWPPLVKKVLCLSGRVGDAEDLCVLMERIRHMSDHLQGTCPLPIHTHAHSSELVCVGVPSEKWVELSLHRELVQLVEWVGLPSPVVVCVGVPSVKWAGLSLHQELAK